MRKKMLLALMVLCVGSPLLGQSAAQHQNRAASMLLNGEYAAACEELQQAARLYKEEEQWPPYFSCLTQLTRAYLHTQQYAEAKTIAKEALWQSISVLGRNNDEAARAAHQLAQVYASAGRFDDAVQYHEMGLDIRQDMFGQIHPAVAASFQLIATTYQSAGQMDQAELFLDKALSILQTTYYEGHPETAPVHLQMGRFFEIAGKPEEARSHYTQAVDIQRESGSADGKMLIDGLVALAGLSSSERAADLYREAMEMIEEWELSAGESIGKTYLFFAGEAADNGRFEGAFGMAKAAEQAVVSAPSPNEIRVQALQLGARCAVLQGKTQLAYELYATLLSNHLYHDPRLMSEGARYALMAGKYEKAEAWSRKSQVTGQGENLLIRAKALLGLGKYDEALSVLEDPFWQQCLPEYAARALLLAGETALGQKDYANAGKLLEEGLELAMQQEGFSSLQLHATLGVMHATLAAQDRNALANLDQAGSHFSIYQQSLEAILRQRPLELSEWQWLRDKRITIYEHALESCFLRHQQQQQESSLKEAFKYAESAKLLDLALEHTQRDLSDVGQQIRYLALRDVPRAAPLYQALLEQWQDTRQAISPDRVSAKKFQQILSSCNAEALSYFVGHDKFYVLKLAPNRIAFTRKSWQEEAHKQLTAFSQLQTLDDIIDNGEGASRLLLPLYEQLPKNGRLILLPAAELATFPYAALPLDGQLMGQRYELYWHTTGSTFVRQYEQGPVGVSSGAPLVALVNDGPQTGIKPQALPTNGKSRMSCLPAVIEWVGKQGSVMNLRDWLASSDTEISLLVLPEWQIDKLLSVRSEQNMAIGQIMLPEPLPDNDQPGSLMYLINSWQERGAGQVSLYSNACVTPDELLGPVTGWLSSGDMSAAMASSLSEQATISVSHMQVYGVPSARPINYASSISVPWILCTVGGLILLGWWVKR